MLKVNPVKVVKIVTTVGGAALSIASSWVATKTMKEEIAKEVAKQLNK